MNKLNKHKSHRVTEVERPNIEEYPMVQGLLFVGIEPLIVQNQPTNKARNKKTLGFQVDRILHQRLLDAAWRKKKSLSSLLRGYCEDSLFMEIIEAGEDLKA
jgi:hypothetical protein